MIKKKKYAVVTINIGNLFIEMGNLTIPLMKNYADKIKADFVVVDKIGRLHTEHSAYWAKFQLYELLDYYERIVYLDLDALVYPHCPDIFAAVPQEKIGVLLESDFKDQSVEIAEFQTRVKNIGWTKEYFNVGIMVASESSREIFNIKHGREGGEKFPEQTRINYNAQKLKIPIARLDYKFNHMYICGNINTRADSYIFHYAGIDHDVRVTLIREDIRRYYAGKLPVSLEEFYSFFQSHFPGKDMEKAMMKYHLFKNSEIK